MKQKPVAYVATTMIDGEVRYFAMDAIGLFPARELWAAHIMPDRAGMATLIERANGTLQGPLHDWTVRGVTLIDEPLE